MLSDKTSLFKLLQPLYQLGVFAVNRSNDWRKYSGPSWQALEISQKLADCGERLAATFL